MFDAFLYYAGWALSWTLQALALFVVATFVFDLIHFILHCFLKSRWRLLRWVGSLHQAHHDFFDTQLRFQDPVTMRNLIWHVVPEYGTQMAVCALGLFVLDLVPVLVVMGFFTVVFVCVLWMRGKDGNHIAFEVLPPAHESLLVKATYHSLHHVYPDSYYSSYTTLFDRLVGGGCQVRGRRFALTGASGAFGGPFKALLERQGAAEVRPLKFGVDYTYDDYSGADEALRRADVLVLAHGSKKDQAMQANCDSFVALIERFKALTRGRRFPVEVWAVGSEIECHGAFGNADLQIYLESKRAFARHARRYFYDRDILYRHIVPSAFRSRMGPGLMSGATAARAALFLIRRGCRYVPVNYTGVALVNYLNFLFRIHAAPAPAPLELPAAPTPVEPAAVPASEGATADVG
jgi:hypothetical protein